MYIYIVYCISYCLFHIFWQELSEHASRVREKTLSHTELARQQLTLNSPTNTTTTQSTKLKRNLSPLSFAKTRVEPEETNGTKSRSLSRSTRAGESLDSEIQKRLRDERKSSKSETGNSNWATAFGRLKMLHTLCDLSEHFTWGKDKNHIRDLRQFVQLRERL